MDLFEKFISEFKLTNSSRKKLEEIFTYKKYKKGDIIAKYNKSSSKIFILKKGIACSYLINKNGKNYIRSLFEPISIITSLPSFLNQKTITINYICLTDCSFLEANYNDYKNLTEKHLDISIAYNNLLNKEYAKLLERNTRLTVLSGTERYLALKKSIPNIEHIIPQYQIAAYLNISSVQLSRIRKKLFSI